MALDDKIMMCIRCVQVTVGPGDRFETVHSGPSKTRRKISDGAFKAQSDQEEGVKRCVQGPVGPAGC